MPRPASDRRCIAALLRRDGQGRRQHVQCIYARDKEYWPLCSRHGTRKEAGFPVVVLAEILEAESDEQQECSA
jgi:hypothetical protein